MIPHFKLFSICSVTGLPQTSANICHAPGLPQARPHDVMHLSSNVIRIWRMKLYGQMLPVVATPCINTLIGASLSEPHMYE